MTVHTGRVSLRWVRFLTVTATGLWWVYLVRTWVSRFEDFSLDLAGTNKLKISVKSNECSNPFLSYFNRDQACLTSTEGEIIEMNFESDKMRKNGSEYAPLFDCIKITHESIWEHTPHFKYRLDFRVISYRVDHIISNREDFIEPQKYYHSFTP